MPISGHRWLALGLGILFACGLLGQALARPALANCQTFMRDFSANLGDMRVEFARTVVVGNSRNEIYTLRSELEVDGTLECRADELLRLDLRIAVPASARLQRQFDRFQPAAVRAALKWDGTRTAGLLARLNRDVADYYRASAERGDVYISGHDEVHLPEGASLGLIFTDTDRSFVITADR
jgi:hypothetical protein